MCLRLRTALTKVARLPFEPLDEYVLEEIAEAIRYKAEFCLACEGAVTSSEYDDMTPDEINIWAKAIHKRNK